MKTLVTASGQQRAELLKIVAMLFNVSSAHVKANLCIWSPVPILNRTVTKEEWDKLTPTYEKLANYCSSEKEYTAATHKIVVIHTDIQCLHLSISITELKDDNLSLSAMLV